MSFRTRIREELICAVCLDFLSEPKVLLCAHSFCLACLEGMVKTKLRYGTLSMEDLALECPSCRHVTPVPGGNAAALKTNYNLKRLVDIVSEDEKQAARAALLKRRTTRDKVDIQQLYVCSKHAGKRMEYFCGECDEILCSRCMIAGHREHGYQHLDDAVPREIEKLRSLIQPACEVTSRAEDLMKQLFKEKDTVSKNTSDIVDAVQAYFRKTIEGIKRREKALVATVRKYGDVKLSVLDTRYNSLQDNCVGIKNAMEQIQRLSEGGINVLKQRQSITEDIDTCQEALLSIVDVAKNPTYLSFKHGAELPADIGILKECTSNPSSIFVSMRQVIVTEDEDPYLDVPLRFEDGTDQPIRRSIRVDDTKALELVSQEERKGHSQPLKSPPALKPHALSARFTDAESSCPTIPTRKNSIRPTKAPRPVPVKRSDVKLPPQVPLKPAVAMKPPGTKSRTLPSSSRVISNSSPLAIKRRQESEVAMKSAHSSNSEDSDLDEYEPIEEIHAPIPAPRKPPALPPNHPSREERSTLVQPPALPPKPNQRKPFERSESADQASITKGFNNLPSKRRSNTLPPAVLAATLPPVISGEATMLLQPVKIFDNNQMSFAYSHETIYPCGISYLKSSQTFIVSDVFNHCLRLIKASGKYAEKIGREGRAGGQFKEPTAIAVDDNEHIYAVERDNPRVQKFNSSGRYITKFGHKTLLGSQLSDPLGIAVSNTNKESTVFVTDWEKNQVFCYNTAGKLLHVIGRPDGFLKFPAGIAVNKEGNILVADRNSHCVWVLTAIGDLISKIGSEGTAPGELHYPYGVAVRENGEILVTESGNCRVSMFSPQGDFLRCFGCRGSEPGMFNHPRHLCLGDNELLAVVDEMNQRVQLFQL